MSGDQPQSPPAPQYSLLEYFVKCHPDADTRHLPVTVYIKWLEGLCYQLIRERKEAIAMVAGLQPSDTAVPPDIKVDPGKILKFPAVGKPAVVPGIEVPEAVADSIPHTDVELWCIDCESKYPHPAEDLSLGLLQPMPCAKCGKTIQQIRKSNFLKRKLTV